MSLAINAVVPSQSFSVREAAVCDLPLVNWVITSAVNSWNLSDRLKRLSLSLLHYDAVDLQDYEILVYFRDEYPLAVGAWEFGPSYAGPDGMPSALFHGLYVRADFQGLGIGQQMQGTVADRARAQGFGGLFVKSQRVSTGYFVQQGFSRTQGTGVYPYQFWKSIMR